MSCKKVAGVNAGVQSTELSHFRAKLESCGRAGLRIQNILVKVPERLRICLKVYKPHVYWMLLVSKQNHN